MHYYSDPKRENETYSLPDVEIFYADVFTVAEWNENEELSEENGDTLYEPGYYYWYCFPGCLPEGDPMGPYDTEENALAAAREDQEQ